MKEPSRHLLVKSIETDRRQLTAALAPRRVELLLQLALSAPQIKVLILVSTGIARTGKELAELLSVSAPTVSHTVDRLVELGYLRREDGVDRRLKVLTATERAQRVHEEVLSRFGIPESVLAKLELEDLRALAQGLSALRVAAESEQGTDGQHAPSR